MSPIRRALANLFFVISRTCFRWSMRIAGVEVIAIHRPILVLQDAASARLQRLGDHGGWN